LGRESKDKEGAGGKVGVGRAVVEGVTHLACSTEGDDRKRGCLPGLVEKKLVVGCFESE
jgi:hypothetical protein